MIGFIVADDESFFDDLLKAVSNNEISSIEVLIDAYIAGLGKMSYTSVSFRAFFNQAIVEVIKTIHALGGNVNDYIDKLPKLYISETSSPDELKAILYNFSTESVQLLSGLKSRQTIGLLVKIEKYIRDNYHENINLKRISEEFYLNHVYLGQLFFKNYNMYFNDYLTKIRIDEAKKLLRTTDMRVYEVADKVGFKNVGYFINKFKKKVNCTPFHYRSQSKLRA